MTKSFKTSELLSQAAEHMSLVLVYNFLFLFYGGGTPIHKLYRDVLPLRVWLFDHLLIKRVSNSKIFYKQGLKIMHFGKNMSGVSPENHKQGINFP